jgi:hypothetical protein
MVIQKKCLRKNAVFRVKNGHHSVEGQGDSPKNSSKNSYHFSSRTA